MIRIVTPTASVQEAALVMFQANVEAVLVADQGIILGMVTPEEIISYLASPTCLPEDCNISEVMAQPLWAYDDQETISLPRHHVYLVKNRQERIVGICRLS